jgi:RNA polymerase sigma-70 factor (ECF subfamily)
MAATDHVYEQLLVLRCQTGDPSAFSELVELYAPPVRRYLRRMLADSHAAEDLLQEIWFEVYRGLGRLKEVAAFRVWLYRIARNRTVRELRKRRPAPRPHIDEGARGTADPQEAPGSEEFARLHAALQQLSAEQREVLLLRFMEGLTYEEIASVAGCPIGTVRSRLNHAKSNLRGLLERSETHDRERVDQGPRGI